MTSTFLRPFHSLRRIWGLFTILALLAAGSAQAAIPASQRQYLLDLYAATGGPNWIDNTGWGGGAGTECNWYGVTCDVGATTITELHLSSNHLGNPVGVSVPDWAALPDLQQIALGNNQLTGPAPAIASLAQLQDLNLAVNQFTGGLPAPAGLQHLDAYNVNANQFSGSIPVLSSLPALTRFTARDNQLTGSIPTLTGVPSLQMLALQNNQLTGGIPALPPGLLWLRVGNNQLTGPVPAAPNSLDAGDSHLCPNYLAPSNSPAWDAATGETPWYDNCIIAPPGLGGATAVPTLGEAVMALLSLAAATLGFAALRRRQV
ncbi:MAG: hypothetical protein WBC18_09815 [Ottowia sp.]|uniref:hypothetical protein n=1 Tax=Ottowia sp. TaxID=1898956 RepID=UPI003C72C089